MNVLEKILEEIEERFKELKEADNMCKVNAERNRNFESMKYFQSLMLATERDESIIGEIIRSHTDEADFKTDNDLISRKILKEEVESLRMIITGMRNGKIMTDKALEEYKKSILKIIDEQPCCSKDTNVAINDGGILRTCDTCRRNGKSDHNCYYCCRKPRRNLWEPKEAGNE